MVAFDAEVLTADPAKIALGDGSTPAADAENPACHAATAGYRTALMFRVVFTSLVVVVAAATAIAIAFWIYKAANGWDAAATFTAIGSGVTGAATIYLGQKMVQSINVARTALQDVGKYCGADEQEELQK
jgi:hypothetical protein